MVYMLNKFVKQFNGLVSPTMSIINTNSKSYNPWITGLVSIFLIGYAGLAAPKLPRDVVEVLAGNPFVKVLFMGAIVWLFTERRNPALAILIAVCFLITTMLLDKYRLSDIATAVQSEVDDQIVVEETASPVEQPPQENTEQQEAESEQPKEEEPVEETPVEEQFEGEKEEVNPNFKEDSPKCEDYQNQANEDYKKYTTNGCNLVSQGCGLKTMENQCGAQGVDCQPNWIPEGYAPF